MLPDPKSEAFRQEYLATLPADHPHHAARWMAWPFGASPDELLELVLAGTKTATASLRLAYEPHGDEPMIQPGEMSVILSAAGEPRCIVETTEINVVPFGQVDPGFAWDEGEGDRSLAFWREVHTRFFEMECQEFGCVVDDDLLVVCERFRMVYRDSG